MANARNIWVAISTQSVSALESALSNGMNANIIHSDGDRPLHKCCEQGFNSGVAILLSKGADPLLLGKEDCTPMMVCVIVDNVEALRNILKYIAPATRSRLLQELLFLSASHNSVKTAKFILDCGADPNLQDPNQEGRAALHWAAQQGSIDVALVLISAGAKPNVTDVDGFSPLHLAAAENEYLILQKLIQAGGDLSMKCLGDKSATPLHIACTWQNIDAAKALIAAKASTSVCDAAGRSPFDVALATGNSELIALFD